jgi:hypothetical protein
MSPVILTSVKNLSCNNVFICVVDPDPHAFALILVPGFITAKKPHKREKSEEISCSEKLDVLF